MELSSMMTERTYETLVVQRRQIPVARVEFLVSSQELHGGCQQGEGADLDALWLRRVAKERW
jgi:hypothetical protein